MGVVRQDGEGEGSWQCTPALSEFLPFLLFPHLSLSLTCPHFVTAWVNSRLMDFLWETISSTFKNSIAAFGTAGALAALGISLLPLLSPLS